MAGPRKKYRQRPKKTGAKKKIRVKSQKKRLVAAGLSEDEVSRLTGEQARETLKKISKKKKPVKKAVKKAVPSKKKKRRASSKRKAVNKKTNA